ncbi:hypothetical protein JOC58_004249 [Paenibacillus hunanensis]|uniref:Cyclic lactone autoinducer peptide n=1 Tax=Paenibacillus hunanensis TaxID=539262 RepID=A0ABU1J490_9BACL|nr:hypothetical protein [Paenibacillus hunanensis]
MMQSFHIQLPKSYMLHLLYHVFHISMSTAFDPLYTYFKPESADDKSCEQGNR